MEGRRFDRWTRTLAANRSRRGLLRGLVGTAVASVFAAGVEEAEAAGGCQRCRKGTCTPRTDGTLCGNCGVCASGVCVANASRCGSCKSCNATTFHCDSRPDDTACGDCGTCHGGRCRANKDKCAHCASCKADGGNYTCKSRCTHGDRCCEDGRCVAANECCTDKDCPECAKCAGGTCTADSARQGTDCGGSTCKACDNGRCVTKPNNTNCPGGLCCGGACHAGAACCDDDGCPECGTCVNFACDRTAKNGQTCGTTPACRVCADGQCVALADGSACQGVIGTCCSAVCCVGNQSCCKGQCCDGTCIPGFGCCSFHAFAAADVSLCCQFGPPCGEGNAAHCCKEGETCCSGICCPAGKTCADEECGGCAQGETACGGKCCAIGHECCNGTCCDHLESCSLDGCCSVDSRCPNVGLPEFARCCSGPNHCFWDGGTTVACCEGSTGEGEVVCSYGCCPDGTICDNRCKDFLGDGVDCCHPPGPDPIPAFCENMQCQPSSLPS